jgi:hypothetical protein
VNALTGNLSLSFESCNWSCGLPAFFWCCHL